MVQYWALNMKHPVMGKVFVVAHRQENVEELNESLLFCCKLSFWQKQFSECVIQSLTFLRLLEIMSLTTAWRDS